MSEQHVSTGQPREREKAYDRPREGSPLGRLAALHDEAAETARLANLLGRTPWLTAALAAGAVVTFALATGLTVELAPALWGLFTLAAALAFLRLYRHALRSPFELLSLRSFQADLKATLLYGGVAWGAGMFLAGRQDNLLIVMAFSVGMVVLVELVLRTPSTALYFAIPSIIVPAAAVALGPLGLAPACLVVAAGASVLAGADIAARLLAARRRPALVTVS